MRTSNQRYFVIAQIILDILTIYLGLVITYYVRFQSGLLAFTPDFLPFETYVFPAYFLIPTYLIIYNFTGHYKMDKKLSFVNDTVDVVKAHTIGVFIFVAVLFVQRTIDYSRLFIILYAVLLFISSVMTRYILTIIKQRAIIVSKASNNVLIVGFSNVAKEFIKKSNELTNINYQIHGILDDDMKHGYTFGKAKVIGSYDQLEAILKTDHISQVIIAVKMEDFPKIDSFVNLCETYGVHTKFIPDYYQYIPSRPYVEDFDGIPMISIRKIPLNDYMNRFMKRTIDLVASFIGIVLLSPVLLSAVVIVKLSSKGPILFRQTRVGLNRQLFTIYKFRSMTFQDEDDEKKAWTTKNDVRVTGIGKFMRKTNIDELPQLFNVLKGDMSLIGPRPERPFFVEQFMHTIPKYMIKHQVRPGMSGWAQVHGWRGDTSIEERIKHDIYYIENWTLLLDIRIMLMTVFGRATNRNAY